MILTKKIQLTKCGKLKLIPSVVQFHMVDISFYVKDFGRTVVVLDFVHHQQFIDVIHPHLD